MNPKLEQYVGSLVNSLSLEPADLDLFELEVESEWDERALKCWEWWGSAPDLLEHGVHAELGELLWMERFFRDREEYERCAILVEVQCRFKQHFPQLIEPPQGLSD